MSIPMPNHDSPQTQAEQLLSSMSGMKAVDFITSLNSAKYALQQLSPPNLENLLMQIDHVGHDIHRQIQMSEDNDIMMYQIYDADQIIELLKEITDL